MDASTSNPGSLVLSYLTLRRAVGILGVLLPFVLVLGVRLTSSEAIPPTISDFYYTVMGDVFVGTMCAIGVFLMSYKGYERRDDLAGDLACAFAIGVALMPTPPTNPTHLEAVVGKLHLASATAFFAVLAYFSLALFTKTDETREPTPQKLKRNRVYRACGWAIVVSIALIAIYMFLPDHVAARIERMRPVFLLESAAVWAFGISWLVKGEAILGDSD